MFIAWGEDAVISFTGTAVSMPIRLFDVNNCAGKFRQQAIRLVCPLQTDNAYPGYRQSPSQMTVALKRRRSASAGFEGDTTTV
jgi:hypothetical protein